MSKITDSIARLERNDLTTTGAANLSGRRYGLLRLRLDAKADVLPGQFAMLRPHGIAEPLLRRAMAYYKTDGAAVEFIYQILGRGTQALAQLEIGDRIDLLGPLGNTYDLELTSGREALLVAGGVGSPGLFLLAQELKRRAVPTRFFLGGASRGDLCGLDDFTELLGADRVACATVDGSYGARGFVTAPLEDYLSSPRRAAAVIYACGPDPMLHRAAQIAEARGVPAQLSLEAPMGCGYGVCVGCAVAVKADCPEGFVYKKVCTDGPVFASSELHW